MIAFRQADARYPFLWESDAQPAGRWHAKGEGPAHYFSDTPDGAWAEFLRHEEITDPEDLATVRRRMWAVEIGNAPAIPVRLNDRLLRGGPETYASCQIEARRARAKGARRIVAPSAALKPGEARGYVVDDGMHAAAPRNGQVIVLFGPPADVIGWIAADAGRPAEDLLDRVHHYRSS